MHRSRKCCGFLLLAFLLCAAVEASHGNGLELSVALPTAKEATEAMEMLLGGEHEVQRFFETAFERVPMYVSDSSRVDRRQWIQVHRRFLRNEDIDSLLRANASTTDPKSPLQLGVDVDLQRISVNGTGHSTRAKLSTFFPRVSKWPSHPQGDRRDANIHEEGLAGQSQGRFAANVVRVVDHARVHQAFADGFELVVYNMQLRSLSVHRMADCLAQLWGVPVTASLHFVPTATNRISEPALFYHAHDTFLVQLDGELVVNVFEPDVESPFPHHIPDESVQSGSNLSPQDKHAMEQFTMKEGDVLYVPRGHGLDTRTDKRVSLHIAFEVQTHRNTVQDLFLVAVEHTSSVNLPNNLLESALCGRTQDKHTYKSLLQAAIVVAAEVTPPLRLFVPLTAPLLSILDEVDGPAPNAALSRNFDNFIDAAKSALFEPLIHALSDFNDVQSATLPPGAQGLKSWAAELIKIKHSDSWQRTQRMFQSCLQILEDHRDDILHMAWQTSRDRFSLGIVSERATRLDHVRACLSSHGQDVTISADRSHQQTSHGEPRENLARSENYSEYSSDRKSRRQCYENTCWSQPHRRDTHSSETCVVDSLLCS